MKPHRPRDGNQLAKHVVDLATGQAVEKPRIKDPTAVRRGRIGGKAKAHTMTPDERSEHGRLMAQARWES